MRIRRIDLVGDSPSTNFRKGSRSSAHTSQRTRMSALRDFSARSKVTTFNPATMAKERRYASAQTFGDLLESRDWARNSDSSLSGSARNAMRVSAQTLSHNSQAWDMLLVSLPITDSVVTRRRTVTWVNRQK